MHCFCEQIKSLLDDHNVHVVDINCTLHKIILDFVTYAGTTIGGESVTQKLQSLESSFSKMLTDIENIRNRRFGWYPCFMYREKHLDRCRVDIFSTYYLENLENEEIKCLIAAYNQERDLFMETTSVLEFQQAVSSTAEFAVPEGKECIKIEVSRNWAKREEIKGCRVLSSEGIW